MPLFINFLLLPSVKALWTPGAPVDDAKWAAQLPLIKEEPDEYRLELVLHARQEILAATTDPASRRQDDTDSFLEDGDSLSDNFFQLATLFVCCTFADCPIKQEAREVWDWCTSSFSLAEDPREGWVGPLVEVLQHQHRIHNYDSRLPKRSMLRTRPSAFLSLWRLPAALKPCSNCTNSTTRRRRNIISTRPARSARGTNGSTAVSRVATSSASTPCGVWCAQRVICCTRHHAVCRADGLCAEHPWTARMDRGRRGESRQVPALPRTARDSLQTSGRPRNS